MWGMRKREREKEKAKKDVHNKKKKKTRHVLYVHRFELEFNGFLLLT